MALTTSSSGVSCSDWDDLADETGFLALGRNRYTCAYVVYTDGTFFYAEEGDYGGGVIFGGPNNLPGGTVSGTDADAVIQACIDDIPATRGAVITVKKGNYPIDTRIDVDKEALIIGEGREATTFTATTNGMTMMTFGPTVSHGGLMHVEFDGDNKASRGLQLNDYRHGIFFDIYIHDVDFDNTSRGVGVYGGDNVGDHCTWNKFLQIHIYNCYHGFWMRKTDGDSYCNANWIENVYCGTIDGNAFHLDVGAEQDNMNNNKLIACGAQVADIGYLIGGIGNCLLWCFVENCVTAEARDIGDRTEWWGRDTQNATIFGAGTRSIVNGVGQNGTNDPSAAGVWFGNGYEGLFVKWDSAGPTHHMSIYTNAAFYDWVVT